TLLVPVISRYVNFISPWSAFLVLGLVVIGIMLHVATSGTYGGAEHHLVTGALADRYFLVPPASFGGDAGQFISSTQGIALLVGLAAIAFVATARLINAEAGARSMSLFLYIVVAVLILAVFAAAVIQPEFRLLGRGG